MATTIIGIDPGLVHTGFAAFTFDIPKRAITVSVQAFAAVTPDPDDDDPYLGPDILEVQRRCLEYPGAHIFIEAYKPRSHYDTDPKMGRIINLMKQQIPSARTVLNTGVLQVISREMLEMLHAWKFQTSTHHQDIRSAARIGLYGAAKNAELNNLLYEVTYTEFMHPGTFTFLVEER